MPKITSVEPQKSSKGRSAFGRNSRFNIFLDGQFAFGADEDLVVDRRLVVGKILERADLEKIFFEAEVGKLMERMYGLLGIRQRSEKEIRDYLKKLSFKRKITDQEELSSMAVEFLIEKLKQKGLINDLEFARSWVEARSKKKGSVAIKAELIQKGISREIIKEVLNADNSSNAEEVATELLEKKMKSWKDADQFSFKKKAYEYLIRKGFDYPTTSSIIAKLLQKR